MKKCLLVVLLFVFCASSHAQTNLILNPSFEDTLGCPPDNEYVYLAKYWTSTDTLFNADSFNAGVYTRYDNCYPDLEHFCNDGHRGGCPNNPAFFKYPRTGKAMMEFGSVPYFRDFHPIHNYLQGRLKTALVAGESYCFTYYAWLMPWETFGINRLDAYFDDATIDTISYSGVPMPWIHPQVIDSQVIIDTSNWTKIQGSFIARGNERFVTIGNFVDSADIDSVVIGYTTFPQVTIGYLIDDISLLPSSSTAYAGPDVHTMNAGDTARLGVANGAGMPCYWYILGNSSPIDSGGTLVVHPDTTTTFVVVMDLCGNITRDTVTVRVHGLDVEHLHRNPLAATFNPNPATDVLTIQDGKGIEVSISQLDGRVVQRYSALQGFKETIDIAQLPAGTYLIHFTDPQTGTFATHKLVKM